MSTGDVALMGTGGAEGLAIAGRTLVKMGLAGAITGLPAATTGLPVKTGVVYAEEFPACTRERTFVPFNATPPERTVVRGITPIDRGPTLTLRDPLTTGDEGTEIVRPADVSAGERPPLVPRTVPCITGRLEGERIGEFALIEELLMRGAADRAELTTGAPDRTLPPEPEVVPP